MHTLSLIAAAGILVAVTGCTGETSTPSDRVVTALREVGTAPLRRDAEAVAARVTTREANGPVKIPNALWTDAIRKFKPEYIYWGSDSLTIVTSRTERYENGIVVYFPSHPDDSLGPGENAGGGSGRADYKMDSGIYWFWQKKRSDAALRRKLDEMESQTNASPNKITGPNAGGPRQFPIWTPLAARVGQFCR